MAILVEDDYDDFELWYPALRLREARAEVTIVSTGAPQYSSTHGIAVQAATCAEQVHAEDFEAIVIPGGAAPEAMSRHPGPVRLVQEAIQQRKIVAAIAHVGRTLATATGESADEHQQDASRLFGRREAVLRDAGPYEDSAVIREGNLITARTPIDWPTFCCMIIAALAEPPASTQKRNIG